MTAAELRLLALDLVRILGADFDLFPALVDHELKIVALAFELEDLAADLRVSRVRLRKLFRME